MQATELVLCFVKCCTVKRCFNLSKHWYILYAFCFCHPGFLSVYVSGNLALRIILQSVGLLTICLSPCSFLCICMPVCLSVCLCLCLSLSVSLSLSLFLFLFLSLSLSLPLSLYLFLSRALSLSSYNLHMFQFLIFLFIKEQETGKSQEYMNTCKKYIYFIFN